MTVSQQGGQTSETDLESMRDDARMMGKVIRVTLSDGSHVDYRPVEHILPHKWVQFSSDARDAHIVDETTVSNEMRVRTPDVAVIDESESLFATEGDE